MEDTILRELGAHGRASTVLTRAMGLGGVGLLFVDAARAGRSHMLFSGALALILIAAAIEQRRD